MQKNTILMVGLGVFIGVAFLAAMAVKKSPPTSQNDTAPNLSEQTNQTSPSAEVKVNGPDPLNTSYSIDGAIVTLTDGEAAVPAAPGSASMIQTSAFGVPVPGDVNGDGVDDAAMIMVQEPGGSGVFYYTVVAINQDSSYLGSNGVLLGDRVSPQNIQVDEQTVIVNYADRAEGEPMTTEPSVAVSKYMQYQGDRLVEVAPPAN